MPLFRLRSVFLFTVFFLLAQNAFPFYLVGDGKKNENQDKKKSSKVLTVQTPDYLLLFSATGQSVERDDPRDGLKKKGQEIVYKLVPNDAEKLFGHWGWLEIEFLDAEGYVIATELVSKETLNPQKEQYGFSWVEAEKASMLQSAKVRTMQAAPEIKQKPETPIPVVPVNEPEKVAQSPKSIPEHVTNEDIAKTLEGQDKQKPTEIDSDKPDDSAMVTEALAKLKPTDIGTKRLAPTQADESLDKEEPEEVESKPKNAVKAKEVVVQQKTVENEPAKQDGAKEKKK